MDDVFRGTRVVDPHTFDADPDQAFYLNANPDPDPDSSRNKLDFFVQNKNN